MIGGVVVRSDTLYKAVPGLTRAAVINHDAALALSRHGHSVTGKTEIYAQASSAGRLFRTSARRFKEQP